MEYTLAKACLVKLRVRAIFYAYFDGTLISITLLDYTDNEDSVPASLKQECFFIKTINSLKFTVKDISTRNGICSAHFSSCYSCPTNTPMHAASLLASTICSH